MSEYNKQAREAVSTYPVIILSRTTTQRLGYGNASEETTLGILETAD